MYSCQSKVVSDWKDDASGANRYTESPSEIVLTSDILLHLVLNKS